MLRNKHVRIPVDELDIWRTAQVLMKRHGEDAFLVGARRAVAQSAEADPVGSRAWIRVVRAIVELQREKPRDGEAVN